jgi:hypothetical protein
MHWKFVDGHEGLVGSVLPTSATAKYRRGSENENIVNIGENIGKYRKMSQGGKIYKNIHFFSIF